MNPEVEDGLERAREHLGRAALETLLAARALMDATFAASGLDRSAPDSLAAEIERGLDGWIEALREGRSIELPAALVDPLVRALGAEIERFEKHSATDSTARPVLRALLALREILWELGVRPHPTAPEAPGPTANEAASDAEPRADEAPDSVPPLDWTRDPDRGSSPFARARARDERQATSKTSAKAAPAAARPPTGPC